LNGDERLSDKHLDADIVDIEDADFFGIGVPEGLEDGENSTTVEAQGVQSIIEQEPKPPVLLPPSEVSPIITSRVLMAQYSSLHKDTFVLDMDELLAEYEKPEWILELLSRIYLFKHTQESFILGKWCEVYSQMRHPEYPQLRFSDSIEMKNALISLQKRLRHMRMTRPAPKGVIHVMHDLVQCASEGQDGSSLCVSADGIAGCTESMLNRMIKAFLLRCVCYCCRYLYVWEMGRAGSPHYAEHLDVARKEIIIYSRILQSNPQRMRESNKRNK